MTGVSEYETTALISFVSGLTGIDSEFSCRWYSRAEVAEGMFSALPREKSGSISDMIA